MESFHEHNDCYTVQTLVSIPWIKQSQKTNKMFPHGHHSALLEHHWMFMKSVLCVLCRVCGEVWCQYGSVSPQTGERHRRVCDQSPSWAQIHRSRDRRDWIISTTSHGHGRVSDQSGKDTHSSSLVHVIHLNRNQTDVCVLISIVRHYEEFDCTEDPSVFFLHFIFQFKFLRRDDDTHVRLEGRDCDDWKCIDFGV